MSFFDYATLVRRIEMLESRLDHLVRHGRVVGGENGKAKVLFPDADGMVSHNLSTLQKNTTVDQDIKMPDIGEPVACLNLGQGAEDGIILGSVYSGTNNAPQIAPGEKLQKFMDGSQMNYDRNTHTMTLQIGGNTITMNQLALTVKIAGGTSSLEMNGTGVYIRGPIIWLN